MSKKPDRRRSEPSPTPPTIVHQSVIGSNNIFSAIGDVSVTIRNDPIGEADRTALGLLSKRVRSLWIDQRLRDNPVGLPWIEVAEGVTRRPVLSIRDGVPIPVPVDRPIDELFLSHVRLMLLGEAGCGKTTLLAQLAQTLVERHDADPSRPVPIVLPLAVWRGEPLGVWIANIVAEEYGQARAKVRTWLDRGAMYILLDGLDELEPTQQSACVAAIQQGLVAPGFPGICVTCRTTDYMALPQRPKMDAAIQLLPLGRAEVLAHLAKRGARFAELHDAIESNLTLKQAASSPFMLSVMTAAFENASSDELARPGSTDAWQRRALELYIDRVLQRRDSGPYRPMPLLAHTKRLARWMHLKHTLVLRPDELSTRLIRTQIGLIAYVVLATAGSAAACLLPFAPNTTGIVATIFTTIFCGSIGVAVSLRDFCASRTYRRDATALLLDDTHADAETAPSVGCLLRKHPPMIAIAALWLIACLSSLPSYIFVHIHRSVPGSSLRSGNVQFGVFYLLAAWGICEWRLVRSRSMYLVPSALFITPLFIASLAAEEHAHLSLICRYAAVVAAGVAVGVGAGIAREHWFRIRHRTLEATCNAVLVFVAGGAAGLFADARLSLSTSWLDAARSVIPVGVVAAMYYGGFDLVTRCVLRLTLFFEGTGPRVYGRFLRTLSRLGLVRPAAGRGFMFTHRLLFDYFAESEPSHVPAAADKKGVERCRPSRLP